MREGAKTSVPTSKHLFGGAGGRCASSAEIMQQWKEGKVELKSTGANGDYEDSSDKIELECTHKIVGKPIHMKIEKN